jgi:hypothetical protein
LQLLVCDWQLPQRARLTIWLVLVTQVATAVEEAVPQLGQALHCPTLHAYDVQGMPVSHVCVTVLVLQPEHWAGLTITPLSAQAL